MFMKKTVISEYLKFPSYDLDFLDFCRKAVKSLDFNTSIWKKIISNLGEGWNMQSYIQEAFSFSSINKSNVKELLSDAQRIWINNSLESKVESSFIEDLYFFYNITKDHKNGINLSSITGKEIKSPTILKYVKDINAIDSYVGFKVLDGNKIESLEDAKKVVLGKSSSFTSSDSGKSRMFRYYSNPIILEVDINKSNFIYRIDGLSRFPEEDEIILKVKENDIIGFIKG